MWFEPKSKFSFSYDDDDKRNFLLSPPGKQRYTLPDLSMIPSTFNTLSSDVAWVLDINDPTVTPPVKDALLLNSFVCHINAFDFANKVTAAHAECDNKCYHDFSRTNLGADEVQKHFYNRFNNDIHPRWEELELQNENILARQKSGLCSRNARKDPLSDDLRKQWADAVIEDCCEKTSLTAIERSRMQLALIEKFSPPWSSCPGFGDYATMARDSNDVHAPALRDLIDCYSLVDPDVRELVANERDRYVDVQGEMAIEDSYTKRSDVRDEGFYEFLTSDSLLEPHVHFNSYFPASEDSVWCNAEMLCSGYDQMRDLFNNPLFKEVMPLKTLLPLRDNTLAFYIDNMDVVAREIRSDYDLNRRSLNTVPYIGVNSSFDAQSDAALSSYVSFTDNLYDSTENIYATVKDFSDIPTVVSDSFASTDQYSDYYFSQLDKIKYALVYVNENNAMRGLGPAGFGIDVKDDMQFRYDFGNKDLVKAIISHDFDGQLPPQSHVDKMRMVTQYFHPNTNKEHQLTGSDIPRPPTVSDVGLKQNFHSQSAAAKSDCFDF